MNRLFVVSALVIAVGLQTNAAPAEARLFQRHAHRATKSTPKANKPTNTQAPQKIPLASDENGSSNSSSPVLTPPSSLIDLTTAKFGQLDIHLKDAAFSDASVKDMHLLADHMDLTAGTLTSLAIEADYGEFQDFTVDDLQMSTAGTLHFDVGKLLDDKVLQFIEPANAQVRVVISQSSLNTFLNSPEVLQRLSGSARKRVPILSTLAHKDVHFGFNFLKSNLELQPDNNVRLTMESRLGVGNGGMPVNLSAETQLALQQGWVNLTNTRLATGGALLPRDMSSRIVSRINSLSKWGSRSDDIHFSFTELKVIPNDRLELAGTAEIRRLRFARAQEASEERAEKAAPPPESIQITAPPQTAAPAAQGSTTVAPATQKTPAP